MRVPSTELYKLIQRLNKEERKKLTIHLKGLGKKGEEYIRLFNGMAKQETYNEKALKAVFKGGSFSITKKRLYEVIMDVLLMLFNSNTYDQLLKELLSFEILYNKKLYKKARKLIYELENSAEKYNMSLFLPLINERIKRLEVNTYKYSHFDEASFYKFIQKKELDGLVIYNTGQYMALQDKLLYVVKWSGNNWRNEIELFLKNPLLLDVNRTKGLMSEAIFYNINQILFTLKQDREKLIFLL